MKHSRHPQQSRRSKPPTFSKGDRVEIFHAYQGKWIGATYIKPCANGPLLRVRADGARHEEYVHPTLVRPAHQGGLEL